MADIAEIGFSAPTGELKDAQKELRALVPAAGDAEKAANSTAVSFEKLDAAADKLSAAASGLIAAADRLDAALSGVTASAGSAASATASVGSAAAGATAGVQAMQTAVTGVNSALGDFSAHVDTFKAQLGSANAAVTGVNANLGDFSAHMEARKAHMSAGWDEFTKSAGKASQAIKFTATDSLNASRQMADIGVTAAMGMSPFMIAIQQGPQLLDILQNKAAVTGQSLGAVFRAAGAAIWSALAPLLPIIAGIAVAVGVVTAAFALGARSINKDNGDIVKGLDLTDKQLKKLKKSGVDTQVTLGDTFKAFFEVLGERVASLFGKQTAWLSKVWGQAMDWITTTGLNAIKLMIGGWTGAINGIISAWRMFPGAVGDLVISAVNFNIMAVEKLLNVAIDGINWIREKAGLDKIATVALARVPNQFQGKAVQAGQAFAKGFSDGFKGAGAAVDRFFADVGKRAVANRTKLIKEAAGDREKGAKTPKGPKSEVAKFSDIVRGAENDIAAQNARAAAAAFELSAQGAATLEFRTKLLNEANSKNIKLTADQKQKVEELAAAYGKAKVAADNAVALREILKASDKDIANLDAQIALIGKYGRELSYAAEMARLLAEAKAKGMTVDAIAAATPQFEAQAGKVADKTAMRDRLTFMEQQRQASEDQARSLQMQRAEIGMTADQVTLYEAEQRALNDALRQHIDLSPAEIEQLRAAGREQGALEIQIRRTREALDFAREGTKGFVNDLLGGLKQGKSAWQSFGDAVLNVLNKISDKLVGGWIDQLFAPKGGGGDIFGSLLGGLGSIFGGGNWASVKSPDITGGIFNAKGNGFDRNGIVDRTTAFAFGKGGANLGIMGEAGPEAIMPLKRGPNGSLGVQMYRQPGGTGGMQRVALTVAIEETENFRGYVKKTAQEEAVDATQAGLQQYDRGLPQRVQQVVSDERAR